MQSQFSKEMHPMKRLNVAGLLIAGMIGFSPLATDSAQLSAQAETQSRASDSRSAFRYGNRNLRTDFVAHPATLSSRHLVTQKELTGWGKTLSNWGRWGAAATAEHPALGAKVTDTKGTLNLITPQKAVEAARLVTAGRVVAITAFAGLNDFRIEADAGAKVPSRWWPISIDPEDGGVGANDAVAFDVHDGIISHMTALCNYWGARSDPSRVPEYGPVGTSYPHQNSVFYNGYPYWVDERGCGALGIRDMGVAYTTRAVLYDIAALKGVEWLDPTTPIFAEDLDAWEQRAGVKAGPGDLIIIRTGRFAQRAKQGAWHVDKGSAGLHASVLPWLKARDVAVVASDTYTDVQPSGVAGVQRPVHQIALVIMGLPLVNNAYTEDVAKAASELKRWEFMVSWKNFDIPGGSASPWNAVAIF
jgi:hypothetical protein